MPPTTLPALYSGKPPGSADRPSGERRGPMPSALPPCTRSPQGSWLNCTPNSGPEGTLRMVGGKWSCTMKLAVRVLKACPDDDR